MKEAAKGLDEGEFIIVHDNDTRGLSWARNRGLDRAKGDYLFFVDADDVVEDNFLSLLLSVVESTGADFVISSLSVSPLKREYNLEGDEIKRVMLPAFFGYSYEDVLRWYRGGSVDANREFGSVCRCVFKRDFIEKYAIRFDENLHLYEDAPFMAECSLYASKISSINKILYNYEPNDLGLMRTSLKSEKYYKYKGEALLNRLALASKYGRDGILDHFRASAVFSFLELFRGSSYWREYLKNDFVRESILNFPLSIRRPFIAMAVFFAKVLIKLYIKR